MVVIESIYGGLGQGLLFALVAIGIFITFRIMKHPDLTCEGAFAFGGALAMTLIVHGVPSIIAVIIAMIGGAIVGFLVGVIHTKLKIDGIVVGILMTMALFSINIFVMGSSTISAARELFIFWPIRQLFYMMGMNANYARMSSFIFVGVIAVGLVIVGLHFLYKTKFGLAIRATGSNENMSRANGINTDTAKITALTLGNAIIALGGALIAQHQSGADVRSGVGVLVFGLAGLVIGEVLTPKKAGLLLKFIFITIGSLIYFVIRSLILITGIQTDTIMLLTALITLVALCVPKIRSLIANQKKPALISGDALLAEVGLEISVDNEEKTVEEAETIESTNTEEVAEVNND